MLLFLQALMKMGVPAIKANPIQFIYNPVQRSPVQRLQGDNLVKGNVLFMLYQSKMLGLCDTVVIILGMKWKQISILNVYHHVTVLFVNYVTFRAAQDCDSYATIVLNGFVGAAK
ncbi:hypothetical protein V7S43_006535 [Phytophthora oleae]|uniref:Elongation of fatty acids protein n=1 Tax=Phytophthora oleae TaxID=2107226 RepID=A0ABD3FRD4_9STRA